MIKIICPRCNTAGSMFLRDARYEGPYRCWKCQALFTLKLENARVISCEPLSQEDFQKWQELEALKAKMKRD